MIAFEDANLRVIFKPGHSDWLLITFGDAASLADGARFFADRVAEKLGLTCLGFMALEKNWYPATSIAAAVPDISYTLRAFDRRLLYGSSMGAYGAIKFSRTLGATDVVAYSPQWSIDPAECGGRGISGYDGQFRPHMAGMAISPADIAGTINIFYDPWDPTDAWHYRRIAATAPAVRGVRVPHAGHHVLEGLKGTALTGAIWRGCMDNDLAGVHRLIQPARHQNSFRRQNLLLKIAERDPMRALRLVLALRARAALRIAHPPAVFLPLLKGLLQRAEHDAALQVLDCLRTSFGTAHIEALLHAIRAHAAGLPTSAHGLLTAHGTTLFYSALDERLTHAKLPLPLGHLCLFPVFPFSAGEFSGLCVQAGGRVLACAMRPNGLVALEPPEACAQNDVLRPGRNAAGALHVKNRGFYLCAEPDGSIRANRSQLGPWEIFHTGSSPPG
jgi:hypothetical protein